MTGERLRRRLVRHHLVIGGVSLGASATIALLASGTAAYRISMATAYVGLGLLGFTLTVGPVRAVRGLPRPRSNDLRRDAGIWTALVALVHVGAGLFVHMGGRPWLYFLEPAWQRSGFPFRLDRFGFANDTGLVATLIVAMLLLLSNDVAMKRLGGRRWKSLQRLNYALFGLVVVHGALYQWVESRAVELIALLALCAMAVVALQAAGFRAVRARRAVPGRPAS